MAVDNEVLSLVLVVTGPRELDFSDFVPGQFLDKCSRPFSLKKYVVLIVIKI